MMALALVALSAGFLGSVHCVFMCGGMSAAAASTGRGTARRIALYQVGRTGSYALIGAFAGLVGSAVDVAGSAVGVSRVAVVLAAVVLVVSGVVTLLDAVGVQVASPGRPGVGQRVSAFVGRRLAGFPPSVRPLVLGGVTGLLPCGFLWTMVALAAGTGSLGLGVVVMVAFALGTLPATTGVGALVASALRRSGRLARGLGGTVVILVGLWTVWQRAGFDPTAWAARDAMTPAPSSDPSAEPPCCHTEEAQ